MSFGKATAAEIDRKLRDDFRRRLKDYGASAETTDPVLAVLFRTFAGQIEAQYHEADRMRLALLDELIAGLGIDPRSARPAQTVVRFGADKGLQTIPGGTELVGEAEGGEKLTFSTDVAVATSPAVLALAATYQEGWLSLAPGVEMPDALRSAQPSLEPVRANLGPNPAIFLAIEDLPASHLSGHALFCELGPDSHSIQRALLSETWCLAGPNGEFAVEGILRPERANAGVRALCWLKPEETAPNGAAPEEAEVATLPDGFYGGRVFVLPTVPASRRFLCRVPKGLDAALGKIFSLGAANVLNRERAWLRISMPREIADLRTGLTSFMLHCATASNVECFNQTIDFRQHGTSIPVSKEAGTSRYLVAPLSVLGGGGSAYLPEFERSTNEDAGRYAIRNGRIELRPARRLDGTRDAYANLRLWVTGGQAGNKVGPGQVKTFLRPGSFAGLRVSSLTNAAGGADREVYQEAKQRFVEALLSRDRIVTRADLVATTRAVDRRIADVDLSAALDRTPQGLRRVERVKIWLHRDDFHDPEEEGRLLQDELASRLSQRVLNGTELRVEVAWK